MNVSSTSTGASYGVQQQQRFGQQGAGRSSGGSHAGFKAGIDAAASTLGLSSGELRQALRKGQSLTDLADSKGVSTTTLSSAVSDAIGKADTSLTSSQAAEFAQRLVAGPQGGRPPGPPPGPPPGGGADRDGDGDRGASRAAVGTAMDAVASSLGYTAEQLRGELSSGSSLESVASTKGMNAEDLKTTIADALAKADSSLSGDEASRLAGKVLAGPPQRPEDPSRLVLARQGTDPAPSWQGSGAQTRISSLYGKYGAALGTQSSSLTVFA
jgi:lambda repressor-like predicted transcriptional regulator